MMSYRHTARASRVSLFMYMYGSFLFLCLPVIFFTNAGVADRSNAKPSPSSLITSQPGQTSPCEKTAVEDHSNAKPSPSSPTPSQPGRTSRKKTAAKDHSNAKPLPSSPTPSQPGRTSPCKKTTVEDHSNAEQSSPLPFIPEPGQSYYDVKTQKGKNYYAIVDKSDFIRRLIDNDDIDSLHKVYFLTRPATFGKSFFLSMVYEFLDGKAGLFDGTAIASRGNAIKEDGKWNQRPVILIDFTHISMWTVEGFGYTLRELMNQTAEKYGISTAENRDDSVIRWLIRALKCKFDFRVSILVDEFDLPMTFALDSRIKKELESFYSEIKAAAFDSELWLVLILGVSRLEVFSGPMNGTVKDITFDDKFSSIMGFLANETKQSFKPHLDKFAEKKEIEADDAAKKIEARYGGYRFCKNDSNAEVLDPGSVCSSLRKFELGDFETKTKAQENIVKRMIKERKGIDYFKYFCVPATELSDNKRENAVPLYMEMLCHGYLTIKQYRMNSRQICLDYPNEGVQRRFERSLPIQLRSKFQTYHESNRSSLRELLREALNKCDMDKFVKLLTPKAFPVVSPSLRFPVSSTDKEFVATSYIFRTLDTLGLNCKEGRELVSTKDGGSVGNVDLIIFAAEKNMPHYAISNKFKNESPYQAISQLFEYLVNKNVEFVRLFGEQVETNVINLVGLQCKDDNYRHTIISAWILVPYSRKDKKILISKTQASDPSLKLSMHEYLERQAYFKENKEKFV